MGILVTKLVKLSEDNTRSEEKKKKRDLKIFHLNNNIIVDKKKIEKKFGCKTTKHETVDLFVVERTDYN